MNPNVSAAVLLGTLALAVPAHAAGTRTYVASTGLDTNTSYSCDAAHPCRTFTAALGQTTDGGEILAVDGTGYGAVTIDRSVSIIANPGVFAGIGVGAGAVSAITIATPGVKVTLRGLTLTGQGGTNGIAMSAGARLTIENCVISNFANADGSAISVATAASVRVIDTVVRDNTNGLLLQKGATAEVSNSRFLGNTQSGILAYGNLAGTVTGAAIAHSVVSGSAYGVDALASVAGATARIALTRSMVTDGTVGVNAEASAGTALASPPRQNSCRSDMI